jgi:hypothetical protein
MTLLCQQKAMTLDSQLITLRSDAACPRQVTVACHVLPMYDSSQTYVPLSEMRTTHCAIIQDLVHSVLQLHTENGKGAVASTAKRALTTRTL